MLKPRGARGHATWTRDRLRAVITEQFGQEQVIVLTNREPFRHERAPSGDLVVKHSTGGVVSAMEPLARTCPVVWIAHGSGTGDRAAALDRDGLMVASGDQAYRLRRIWLDAEEEQGYYYGAANEGLWPLCHRAHVQPVFRSNDLNSYWAVNRRFADAVCEEATGPSPFVLVQDYHLALAPSMIRERLPESTIVTFWHIPWPCWQTFDICPWKDQLLNGLLGSDIMGLQTALDCRNFIDAVEHSLAARLDRDANTIRRGNREVAVRAYPASIDWPGDDTSSMPPIDVCRGEIRRQLAVPDGTLLGIGVDRLDYTKGLVEKFLAVERLLEYCPEFRGRFVFAQLAAPSRDRLPAYRDLRSRLVQTVDRINTRFGAPDYRPAILLETHYEPDQVFQLLRAADVCYVGSLHDGMNLVAKEFVAARDDGRGVLVLTSFAGAARQLSEALVVNPYDVDESACVLQQALTMPDGEQRDRMRRMRLHVAENSAFRWAGEMLSDAAQVARERISGYELRAACYG